ncbi:NADP-dependent oxidoreductase domain-containing protein [Abortiporus biennis]|nr:NADP-dependent oxidoreductase domain-containing protein [Abortiporus biennis]
MSTQETSQPEGAASSTYAAPYPLTSSVIAGPSGTSDCFHIALPPDEIPTSRTLITLGGSEGQPLLKVPAMGVGAFAWGDVITYGWGPAGGYDKRLDDKSVSEGFDELVKIYSKLFIDVSEHYGSDNGYAEHIVGFNLDKHFTLAQRDQRVVLATKFVPSASRHPYKYPQVVQDALQESLNRLQTPSIDIYQLQGPSTGGFWPRLETLADGLARCYEAGKIKAVGTCNLGINDVRWLHDYFQKRNVPYVSNQVEFSLLHMEPYTSGLIRESRSLGIATIAYSPLAVGRLTGKYSSKHLPEGYRNLSHISWDKIEPILDELISIGQKHGKTPGAVALNWVMCKGAIPIPSIKNAEQAKDCAEALGWRLTEDEETRLNSLGLVNERDWNIFRKVTEWCYHQASYYPVVNFHRAPFVRSPKWSSPFARNHPRSS